MEGLRTQTHEMPSTLVGEPPTRQHVGLERLLMGQGLARRSGKNQHRWWSGSCREEGDRCPRSRRKGWQRCCWAAQCTSDSRQVLFLCLQVLAPL